MNQDFIFSLIELTNKVDCEDKQSALMRMAMLVEMEMSQMEASGIEITREALLEIIKSSIKIHNNSQAA